MCQCFLTFFPWYVCINTYCSSFVVAFAPSVFSANIEFFHLIIKLARTVNISIISVCEPLFAPAPCLLGSCLRSSTQFANTWASSISLIFSPRLLSHIVKHITCKMKECFEKKNIKLRCWEDRTISSWWIYRSFI